MYLIKNKHNLSINRKAFGIIEMGVVCTIFYLLFIYVLIPYAKKSKQPNKEQQALAEQICQKASTESGYEMKNIKLDRSGLGVCVMRLKDQKNQFYTQSFQLDK